MDADAAFALASAWATADEAHPDFAVIKLEMLQPDMWQATAQDMTWPGGPFIVQATGVGPSDALLNLAGRLFEVPKSSVVSHG